jgi:hypothetical protein
MEGDYSNQTSNNLEVNQPFDTSLTQTFDNFGNNQTSNLNVDNNDNNNYNYNYASQSGFTQSMPGDLVQNDTFGEVGTEVKVHKKRKKLSRKAILVLVTFVVLGLVVLGLIALVVYYWQKSQQSHQALTCKAGSGATCDLAGNTYSCTPILGPNTQVVSNTVQPSQAVCPSGCTLGSNYVCDCTPPACPKLILENNVVKATDDKGDITFSVDSGKVCNPSNNVNWDKTNSTCESTSTFSCTQCNDTTKNVPSVSDPSTWVTCNTEKCEGSLVMNYQASCSAPISEPAITASGAADTAGTDFAGMFDCINNGGSNCAFKGVVNTSACLNKICPAFSMNSNTDSKVQYTICKNTTPSSKQSGSVMIAPFGNTLPATTTSAVTSKVPGW